MSSMRNFLKGYRLVARFEYIPAELAAVFIPLLIGANSINTIFSYTFIESLIIFTLLFLGGFLINSLTDVDVDRKYKDYVSTGVDIIGRRTLKLVILLHVSIALILALHVSMTVQNIWLFAWVLVGTFFGLGYSAKPFHFKVRGTWHAIALTTSAFLVPFTFLYLVIVGRSIDINAIILIIGFSIAHYGLALTNQVGDYTEDKETGLLTPAVRWGIKKTLKLSALLMTIGLLIGIYAFTELLLTRGTMSYIIPNAGMDSRLLAAGIVVAALGIGYSVPILGTLSLYRIAKRSKTILESVSGIKKRMNYPRWQASGAVSILLVSMMLFTTSLISTYKNTGVENPVVSISAGQDKIVNVGMLVEFKGLVTTSTDKGNLNYTWVFNDQSNITTYDYKQNSTHTFSKDGVYPVEFIVRDNNGDKFMDRINITVMHGFSISSNATGKLNHTDPLKMDVEVATTISNAGVNQTDNVTLTIEQIGTGSQNVVAQRITLRTNETVNIKATLVDVSVTYYTFSVTLSCNGVTLDSDTIVVKPL